MQRKARPAGPRKSGPSKPRSKAELETEIAKLRAEVERLRNKFEEAPEDPDLAKDGQHD